jgi:sec-independent protein translocase protein TatC
MTATPDTTTDGNLSRKAARKAAKKSVPPGHQMTIWEHLAELRRRILVAGVAVLAGAVVAYLAWPLLIDTITNPFCRQVEDCQLYATDPLAPFATRIQVAAYGGIILAMPVLLWQLWRFVTPGLNPNERKYAVPFVGAALLLFSMGAVLAFIAVGPALQFLFAVAGPDVVQIPTVDRYLSLVMWMMVAFGVGFEFPVLLVALQMVGILKPSQLAGARRYAAIGIVIAAALITPSGDPITLMVLAVPMYLLYEVSILIGWVFARRRRSAAALRDIEQLS